MSTDQAQTPQQSILGGGNLSVQQTYELGLKVVQGICSIIALPIEYALRPLFGSRYFNPITTFFSCVLMFVLAGAGALGSFMPSRFGGPPAGVVHRGLIGLATLSALFFLGNIIHGVRVYRRMLHPEREAHSEFEGPALPFLAALFARLPHGHRFWPVRIVYEPLAIIIATVTLSVLGVLNRPAAMYLLTAAVLLSIKCAMEWYRAWLHIRILLDGQAAAPIIAAAIKGTATEDDMARIHLAGFPKSLSPELKAAAIAQRTGVLPPHIASLVSPVDEREAA
ncbi:MAG TPA: hypothetical protein VMF91_07535 [Bryobacteraceae bacterium]|nr:hypothetical protein [Bryobacteraceae bacterium]